MWRFRNHPFCTIFFLNDRSQKKLSRLHVTYEGTIESNGQGMLQVSAYKSICGFRSCLCHTFMICQPNEVICLSSIDLNDKMLCSAKETSKLIPWAVLVLSMFPAHLGLDMYLVQKELTENHKPWTASGLLVQTRIKD